MLLDELARGLIGTLERAAAGSACAEEDAQLRLRDSFISGFQRMRHRTSRRAGDGDPVGAPWRGDELDAEAAPIAMDDLPPGLSQSAKPDRTFAIEAGKSFAQVEAELIRQTLLKVTSNRTEPASGSASAGGRRNVTWRATDTFFGGGAGSGVRVEKGNAGLAGASI